jgi:receptor-type tyrosine-protein phosphatase gamma
LSGIEKFVLTVQKKCDQYWPKEGTETYGLIQVRLVQEDVLATYTIRKFAIRHMKVCTRKKNIVDIKY